MYADDTQIYITFKTFLATQGEASVQTIEACVSALRTWMIQNKLKCNDDKTELLVITSPRLQSKLTINSITIGESVIQSSTKARNLGVIFDHHMDMEAHVTALTQACYGQLRKISHIRRYLTTKAAEQLSCTASLLPAWTMGTLYLWSAWLPTIQAPGSSRQCCPESLQEPGAMSTSRSVLQDLHRLSVKQWVYFKIMLMTYKVLHDQAPQYLSELIHHYRPHHALRSSSQQLLQVPMTRLVTYGQRSFLYAAPTLWNSLPSSIKAINSINEFKTRKQLTSSTVHIQIIRHESDVNWWMSKLKTIKILLGMQKPNFEEKKENGQNCVMS